jgi:hypothetical protein
MVVQTTAVDPHRTADFAGPIVRRCLAPLAGLAPAA